MQIRGIDVTRTERHEYRQNGNLMMTMVVFTRADSRIPITEGQ